MSQTPNWQSWNKRIFTWMHSLSLNKSLIQQHSQVFLPVIFSHLERALSNSKPYNTQANYYENQTMPRAQSFLHLLKGIILYVWCGWRIELESPFRENIGPLFLTHSKLWLTKISRMDKNRLLKKIKAANLPSAAPCHLNLRGKRSHSLVCFLCREPNLKVFISLKWYLEISADTPVSSIHSLLSPGEKPLGKSLHHVKYWLQKSVKKTKILNN